MKKKFLDGTPVPEFYSKRLHKAVAEAAAIDEMLTPEEKDEMERKLYREKSYAPTQDSPG